MLQGVFLVCFFTIQLTYRNRIIQNFLFVNKKVKSFVLNNYSKKGENRLWTCTKGFLIYQKNKVCQCLI
nr:MAG TPA: hypothetical protein [Caudoviricetes sp.]